MVLSGVLSLLLLLFEACSRVSRRGLAQEVVTGRTFVSPFQGRAL